MALAMGAWRGLGLLLVGIGLLPAIASAQVPPAEATVEADPIRCWWRTSAGAVRIGETFSLEMTCAVLDTEAVRVEPDESRLGNNVIQLAPFEVVDGAHPADLRSGQRRFFQYQYTLRIINPDAIGTDVPIPPVSIRYRVSSRMPGNASMQGRDLVYLLPPQVVRVLSTVPLDATDIRDAGGQSFSEVETLTFRGRTLELIAITLVVLGGLMAIAMAVRLLRAAVRPAAAGARVLGPRAALSAASRELESVQRETEQGGWNEALVGRALAATRVAAAVALDRPVNQRTDGAGGEGRVPVSHWGRPAHTVLSSRVTEEDVVRQLARLSDSADPTREMLDPLRTALATFTQAQYSRQASPDRAALDAAAAAALEGANLSKRRHGLLKTLWQRWSARAVQAEQHS